MFEIYILGIIMLGTYTGTHSHGVTVTRPLPTTGTVASLAFVYWPSRRLTVGWDRSTAAPNFDLLGTYVLLDLASRATFVHQINFHSKNPPSLLLEDDSRLLEPHNKRLLA